MTTLIFTDFDGTVSRRDVGYSMFYHFSGGRNDALLPDWKAGRITSREVLMQEAAMVSASPAEIMAFLDQFVIDEGFKPFVALCRQNGIEPVIVSDGLDFYIKHILSRHDLGDLEVVCNVGTLHSTGLNITFPRDNTACPRCGNCKGEIIEEYKSRVTGPCRTIFIGDGYSDTCAARTADVLLAKKDLAHYCRAHNIAYNTYDTFFDVILLLTEQGYLRP